MGLDFRNGSYRRYVRLGKRTVKDGEAACVWYMDGTSKMIVGPALVRLFYANIRFLDRHSATSTQYLRIRFVDGHCEHVAGPISMYMNPVIHTKISTEPFIKLKSSKESVVVFSRVHMASTLLSTSVTTTAQSAKAKADIELQSDVEKPATSDQSAFSGSSGLVRRVITGPHCFMPSTYDEVHTFEWSSNSIGAFQVLSNKQVFKVGMPIKTKNNEEATIHIDISIM